ncbi:hypothetical protein [Pseudomonas beijingensis]|uniref:hypothetical protein n=1 Tax=Pseudomonas beijingensis TaxID=2954101 RepID=UPI0027357AF6|nr:hypothetical protein [Pseudomonas sp. FP2262]WLH43932.1 hypothetical protein PSH83_16210 [Pseudomonas sp. FP2262]
MDLSILRVEAQGDEKKEYVILRAKEKCNLKEYMIFDETFKSDGSASNKHRHVFIFPDWEVKENEYLYLFTGTGENKKGTSKDGSVASYFYWGLNSPVWNEGGDKVHLIKVKSAIAHKIPKVA